MKKYFLLLIVGLIVTGGAFCQSDNVRSDIVQSAYDSMMNKRLYTITPETDYIFERPRSLSFFRNFVSDNKEFYTNSFRKKNWWLLGGIIASSAVLYVYDQQILEGVQHFGRQIHIPGDNKQVAVIRSSIKFGKSSLYLPIYLPSNLNTSMYYIGDGLMPLSMVSGFWAYGLIKKDNRARQTSSQILQALLSTGIATQIIKHVTGRESPFTTDYPRGRWKFFPNQVEYAKHVPQYDAFPTGHLAAAMATFVVISDNYPEKKWIKPVGYSMLTMLAFAMVNNGVHWASDYPLGIAIGYGFGKIASRKGKKVVHHMKRTDL